MIRLVSSVFRGLGLVVVMTTTLSLFVSHIYGQKVRLRSQITPNCGVTSNFKFSDLFGDGNIAVLGSYDCRGAFIFDITNPDAPVLASWYNPQGSYSFLEAVVIGNRGYFGAGNGGGVHIVDLTNPYSPVLLGIVNSTNGNGHNSIHEMVIFNQNGNTFLVENFNSLFSTKILKVINVTNPAIPVFVRDITPTEPQWVHAMVVKGNRMFTSGWGCTTCSTPTRGRTEIYDISNITTQAPALLGFISDQTSITAGNNMHSAWPSEDGNYLYSCRETTNGTGDVRVYNISNPAAPLLVNSIGMNALGLNAVAPHNPVVAGNYLYVSWYQAGIQVFDLTNPASPKRVGQYDTFSPTFAPASTDEKEIKEGGEKKTGVRAGKSKVIDAEPWDIICGADNLQNALPTNYDGNWAVYPFLGPNKILAGDLANGLLILDATQVSATLKNRVSDFDGDKRTDLSVFSPNQGVWRIETSSDNLATRLRFGQANDILVAGDYNGDGKTDIAVYRPSNSTWYIKGNPRSKKDQLEVQFGLPGDVPVPADYDADGKTDIAVWRPSNATWYISQSTLGQKIQAFGAFGDKPIIGDYDGDGKIDIGVWRPTTGAWSILQSSSSITISNTTLGQIGDKPVMADFDGNGVTDFAVFRPSNGTWYAVDPITGVSTTFQWGSANDIPIPADYDGDGKADFTVFRPSTNEWLRYNSATGTSYIRTFGQAGDTPSPSSIQPQ